MNSPLADLTDLVLRLKEAFESGDPKLVGTLFTPDARINIAGRFQDVPQMMESLALLYSRVEQPVLELVRVEQSEMGETDAFVAYAVEVFWIDREAWEEHAFPGTMSLDATGGPERWLIRGFTYSRAPEVQLPEEPGPVPEPGPGTGGELTLRGLFSFWY
jgi:hypothetical protein